MAITITDSPINYSPAYSPCIYVVNEDTLFAETEFKYITEIYAGGQKKAELKSFPHPIYKWGKFDISGVVQNLLEERIDFEAGVYSAAESIQQVQARFGYEYINTSGSFVRLENSGSSTEYYFNGSPFYTEFTELRDLDPNHPRVITSGTGYEKYPLTTRKLIETADDTKQWLYYISSDYTNISSIQIKNNETSATDTIPLPTSLQNNFDGKLVAFRVDRGFIEANTVLTNLKKYRVRTLDDATTPQPTSEWIDFEVMECSRWTPYSLYYLNRWGGIDSLSFTGRSSQTISQDSETYRTDNTPIGSTGIVDYNETNRRIKRFYTEHKKRLRLNSGWIDHSTKLSAKDLQTSPAVWLENEDGVILPVEVTSAELRIEDSRVGRPIQINTTVEYTEPIKRQRT